MKIIGLFTAAAIIMSCNTETKYQKAANEIADSLYNTGNLNVGNEKYNVYIPKGWTTKHTTYHGVNFFFLQAPATGSDPNTSINILTEYMQNLPLEDFKQKTIESITKSIPSAIITGEGNIISNGIKGGWYSYTMEPTGVKASLVAYIFPKNGVAYIITAGTQPNNAVRYRSIFDSVARSFKFIE